MQTRRGRRLTDRVSISFYPILGSDEAHKLSPDDDRLVMMKPPFHTIADEVAGGNDFWVTGLTNPNDIDYDKAVISPILAWVPTLP